MDSGNNRDSNREMEDISLLFTNFWPFLSIFQSSAIPSEYSSF